MSVELVCDRCQDGAPMGITVMSIGYSQEHMGPNPIQRAKSVLPKDWTLHVHPADHEGMEMMGVVLCPVCTRSYNDWLNPDYTATQQAAVNADALERRRKDRKTRPPIPTQHTVTEDVIVEPGPDEPFCHWCADELNPAVHPHTCADCQDEFCSGYCYKQHVKHMHEDGEDAEISP